jgi:hypothetical protein
MKMKLMKILVFGTILSGGVTGMYSVRDARAAGQGQCRQEIHQLCATAEQGPARQECVKQHFTQLSPACQEKLRARWEKQQQKTTAPASGSVQSSTSPAR